MASLAPVMHQNLIAQGSYIKQLVLKLGNAGSITEVHLQPIFLGLPEYIYCLGRLASSLMLGLKACTAITLVKAEALGCL